MAKDLIENIHRKVWEDWDYSPQKIVSYLDNSEMEEGDK